MIAAIDRIMVEVPDLKQAASEYAELFGEFPRGEERVRFPFSNTCVELQQADPDAPARIVGLAFLDEVLSKDAVKRVPSPNEGIRLQRVGQPSSRRGGNSLTGISTVDHVVMKTIHAERCLRTFGNPGLGLRLALDQDKPRWGGRMLFFRAGKLTLEIIEPYQDMPERDFFWGIAYQCEDLEQSLELLEKRGIKVSESREGRKQGTRVATLKSHDLGIPTLLIEHVS